MKSDAVVQKKSIPYIYEYYNIFCWTQSPIALEKSVLAKIVNSLTDCLNKIHRVPKYLLVIPDKDILDTMNSELQAESNLDTQLEWLVNNVHRAITRRREDLKDKRPGAIASSFETMVIWVKMLDRPQVSTCRGAMNNKELVPCSRRGLLAYVYNGVSD